MGTDRYAYQSGLRKIDPIQKLCFSFSVMLLCLFCESIVVGVFALFAMAAATVFLGGQSARVVLRFLRIPLVFIIIGCVTIAFRPIAQGDGAWLTVKFFGKFLWGVRSEYLLMAALVFFKAMGCISAMYFLSLTTPVTDLITALHRMRCPQLLIELMELIYRFIFVLSGEAGRIRTAQESRLGYRGVRRSISSLGLLSSMVFLRAWRRGDRVWSALESRGCTGGIKTVSTQYSKGNWLYALSGLAFALLPALMLLERRLLPWLTQ